MSLKGQGQKGQECKTYLVEHVEHLAISGLCFTPLNMIILLYCTGHPAPPSCMVSLPFIIVLKKSGIDLKECPINLNSLPQRSA